MHGRVEGARANCAVPGCAAPGEYKAPLQPANFDGPGSWRFLCLDHVREHNAKYNFFDGMSADEISEAQSPLAGWDRPSRKFAGPDQADRTAAEFLNPHAFLELEPAGGGRVNVQLGDPLPAGPFRVLHVGFSSRVPDREAFFRHVGGLRHVGTVTDWFNKAGWTDADLARLADAPAAASLQGLQIPGLELSANGVAAPSGSPETDRPGRADGEGRRRPSGTAREGRARAAGTRAGRARAYGGGVTAQGRGGARPAVAAAPEQLRSATRVELARWRRTRPIPRPHAVGRPRDRPRRRDAGRVGEAPKLDTLDVGPAAKVTDAGLKHLAGLRARSSPWTSAPTGVTADGVKLIAAARPDVRVVWAGG